MKRVMMNRVFLIAMIGLLLVGMVGVVVGQEDGSYVKKAGDSFVDFWSSWQTGEIGANTAKIIFAIVIGIGLFLLLSSTLDKNNKYTGVLIVVSALLSFLFTAYIAPAEIYAVLNSYTALGLTLITLIPFGVLGLLTWKAAESKKPSIMVLQWVAWLVFAFYLGYRVIMDLAYFHEGSAALNISLLVAAAIAGGVVIFNNPITKALSNKWQDARKEKASATWQAAQRTLKKAAETEEELAE